MILIEKQKILDKAWELKQEAYKLEESIADMYRNKVVSLCKKGKKSDALYLIQELDWHESICKFDLICLVH